MEGLARERSSEVMRFASSCVCSPSRQLTFHRHGQLSEALVMSNDCDLLWCSGLLQVPKRGLSLPVLLCWGSVGSLWPGIMTLPLTPPCSLSAIFSLANSLKCLLALVYKVSQLLLHYNNLVYMDEKFCECGNCQLGEGRRGSTLAS